LAYCFSKLLRRRKRNDTVFTAITSAPGFDELGKYLSKSLHYPSYDLKNNVQGKVYLQFVVEADGSYLIL
jgi:hypothetical protein